ncbi:acyl carrier protein [Mitsuaria sp. TWR114]|jgi:acyl carrier protein|uniref:acyl carrier protein n=1 Tax=unclassified Roseateles TaxID=2626991 RepID=UPI0011BE9660|nr:MULTISPECIES: acyl carrier protein [unclassified Roseateles]MBB3295067.1 acyl carrier protein [Mitsuaria sp. BK041]MBB3364283.1 acyl carrier protein [Mitsuaria sp. BK045]TXD89536.1 acyl carrier protein [Mitsuaria sp. TWR114]
MTDQDIFERLRTILIETFDIDAERITPQARLYEDLDIDSIDAVDLIVRLKPLVGKRLQPEAFKTVRTLQDVINALQGLLQAESGTHAKTGFEGAVAPTNS